MYHVALGYGNFAIAADGSVSTVVDADRVSQFDANLPPRQLYSCIEGIYPRRRACLGTSLDDPSAIDPEAFGKAAGYIWGPLRHKDFVVVVVVVIVVVVCPSPRQL
jgi:hypothetical protein